MSVHNGAATLEVALRSILWQTFSDWEMILVKDASTDSTGPILDKVQDPRIRVIHEHCRGGLATRLNQCVDFGRGKYVARMDADDIAYPDRFQQQIEYLNAHPEVDLLGHGALLFKNEGTVVGLYPVAERHEEICRRPWWGFPLAHPTWMGKRAWFQMQRYDETLEKGQDQELLLRSWRTSRFASLSECLLGYRVDKISVKKSAAGRFAYCRRLVSDVRDLPSLWLALRGIGLHGAALTRDAVLDMAGIVEQGARQSLYSADTSTADRWRAIWKRLCPDQ